MKAFDWGKDLFAKARLRERSILFKVYLCFATQTRDSEFQLSEKFKRPTKAREKYDLAKKLRKNLFINN